MNREEEKEYCWKMIEKLNEGKLDTERGIDLRTEEDLSRIDYWRDRMIFGEKGMFNRGRRL